MSHDSLFLIVFAVVVPFRYLISVVAVVIPIYSNSYFFFPWSVNILGGVNVPAVAQIRSSAAQKATAAASLCLSTFATRSRKSTAPAPPALPAATCRHQDLFALRREAFESLKEALEIFCQWGRCYSASLSSPRSLMCARAGMPMLSPSLHRAQLLLCWNVHHLSTATSQAAVPPIQAFRLLQRNMAAGSIDPACKATLHNVLASSA